jgi:hypothetical protein
MNKTTVLSGWLITPCQGQDGQGDTDRLHESAWRGLISATGKAAAASSPVRHSFKPLAASSMI